MWKLGLIMACLAKCVLPTFLGKDLSYVNADAYAPPSPLLKICTYLDIKHLDSAWLADGAIFGGG